MCFCSRYRVDSLNLVLIEVSTEESCEELTILQFCSKRLGFPFFFYRIFPKNVKNNLIKVFFTGFPSLNCNFGTGIPSLSCKKKPLGFRL